MLKLNNSFYVYKKYNIITFEEYIEHFKKYRPYENSELHVLQDLFNINLSNKRDEANEYLKMLKGELNESLESFIYFSKYLNMSIGNFKECVQNIKKLDNQESLLAISKSSKIISIDTSSIGQESNVKSEYSLKSDSSGLFTELAKIRVLNDSDLIKFCKSFGLPSGTTFFGFNNSSNDFIVSSTIHLHIQIKKFKRIFKMYIAIKNQDKEMLNDIYFQPRYNSPTELRYSNPSYELMLRQVKVDITRELNQIKTANESILNYDLHKDKFNKEEIIKDLFQFAYLQLEESLIKETNIKKCEYCGSFFEVTQGKQQFCHPLPNRKKSSCKMAFNRK